MIPVTRTNIAPGVAMAWTDVDVSAYVDPGNTAGVMLEIVSLVPTQWGVRNNGSTDGFGWLRVEHTWAAVGVDANNIFECYIGVLAVEVYIVAYIPKSAGNFFTNGILKALPIAASWEIMDISGDTGGDTALCAFFLLRNDHAVNVLYGLRENGSTDDRRQIIITGALTGAMMSADSDERIGFYGGHVILRFFFLGYLTDKFESFVNAKDYSTGNIGTWEEVNMESVIPLGFNGAFMHFFGPGVLANNGGIRKKGETYSNYFRLMRSQFFWVELDEDRKAEQIISNTNLDLFLWGYSGEAFVKKKPSEPTDLLCEQKKNPTDVTDPQPEFSAIHNA